MGVKVRSQETEKMTDSINGVCINQANLATGRCWDVCDLFLVFKRKNVSRHKETNMRTSVSCANGDTFGDMCLLLSFQKP